jgi:hypothetical protein
LIDEVREKIRTNVARGVHAQEVHAVEEGAEGRAEGGAAD